MRGNSLGLVEKLFFFIFDRELLRLVPTKEVDLVTTWVHFFFAAGNPIVTARLVSVSAVHFVYL